MNGYARLSARQPFELMAQRTVRPLYAIYTQSQPALRVVGWSPTSAEGRTPPTTLRANGDEVV